MVVGDQSYERQLLALLTRCRDPCEWSDGLNATGYRDFSAPINHALPLEAIINRRLTQLAGPPVAPQTENPICKYFGFAVDQRNRRWKLFLEYCPGGSLFDFHQSLIAAGGLQRPPEPFVSTHNADNSYEWSEH